MSLSRRILEFLNEETYTQRLDRGATAFFDARDRIKSGENPISVVKSFSPEKIVLMLDYAASEIENLQHARGYDFGKL